MNLPWYFILDWKLQSCAIIFLIAYFIPLAITKNFWIVITVVHELCQLSYYIFTILQVNIIILLVSMTECALRFIAFLCSLNYKHWESAIKLLCSTLVN